MTPAATVTFATDSMQWSPAAIVADFREAIDMLIDADTPATTRTAERLSRWLVNGLEFENKAVGLSPNWRAHLRLTARNHALDALLKMHADMNASALATWIVEGIERVSGNASAGVRPDGADGYLVDLVRAGRNPAWRQWHRLITEARLPSESSNGKDE